MGGAYAELGAQTQVDERGQHEGERHLVRVRVRARARVRVRVRVRVKVRAVPRAVRAPQVVLRAAVGRANAAHVHKAAPGDGHLVRVSVRARARVRV